MDIKDIEQFYKKYNITIKEYDFYNSPNLIGHQPSNCKYDYKSEPIKGKRYA